MKKSRFSEEKIIAILKEAEAGVKTAELCRKNGVSSATLYNWKARYDASRVAGRRSKKAIARRFGTTSSRSSRQSMNARSAWSAICGDEATFRSDLDNPLSPRRKQGQSSDYAFSPTCNSADLKGTPHPPIPQYPSGFFARYCW